jgi:hypothetical protein
MLNFPPAAQLPSVNPLLLPTWEVDDPAPICIDFLDDLLHLSFCQQIPRKEALAWRGYSAAYKRKRIRQIQLYPALLLPVGDFPSARMTVPSSLVVMQPSPSCSLVARVLL